jgi:hypothetical protein
VLAIDRHAIELRDSWQGRCLAAARGKTAAVLLSVLAHSYDDAMMVLLKAVFPGFKSITAPFFSTAGKVAKTGHIVADMVTKTGKIAKDFPIYLNEIELRDDFRRLADQLKLNDADRVEMFGAVKRWVVADRRLDPTMDPKDPDAKRLIVH